MTTCSDMLNSPEHLKEVAEVKQAVRDTRAAFIAFVKQDSNNNED